MAAQPFVNVTSRIFNFADRFNEPDPSKLPASLEIHLTNICNNSCNFCWAADGLAEKYDALPTDRLLHVIQELAQGGALSVVLSGGGEPTLHKDFELITDAITSEGLRFGVISNGIKYDSRIETGLLRASWVKFSLNGGTPEHYQRQTRRAGEEIFDRVSSNIRRFLSVRSKDTVVSVSMIINGKCQDDDDIRAFFNYAVDVLNVDYVLFRPYIGDDPMLKVRRPKQELSQLATELSAKARDHGVFTNFPSLVRDTNSGRQETEGTCPLVQCGLLGAITADGNVHLCLPLPRMGFPERNIGSILTHSLSEIWRGERRRLILKELTNAACPPCKYERMFPLVETMRSGQRSLPSDSKRDPHWCFL